MTRRLAAPLLAAWALAACAQSPEAGLLHAIETQTTGSIRLPRGVLDVSGELVIPAGAHDLEIAGDPAGTTLRAAPGFQGRAILVIDQARNIRLRDFGIEGNRETAPRTLDMAPPENAFRNWYRDNGILADRVTGLDISHLQLAHVTNFPILVSRCSMVRIENIAVADSGSLNRMGRNNLSGGVLMEEGTSDFQVRDSSFTRIAGNALWTHSIRTSPRLKDGIFLTNRIDTVGRDGIEIGAATKVTVDSNTIRNVGFPVDLVDKEHAGTPVGIDTAGNVDASVYRRNRLEEIDGKCFDLDGFHDGSISDNICVNRKPPESYPFGHFGMVMNNTDPDMRSQNIHITGNTFDGMKFGGLFLIGSGHVVTGNRFLNLNTAGCNESAARFGCIYKKDEPEMLDSGIYLGRAAERPAVTRDNLISGNVISGHGMRAHCIAAAPGVELPVQGPQGNTCTDTSGARGTNALK